MADMAPGFLFSWWDQYAQPRQKSLIAIAIDGITIDNDSRVVAGHSKNLWCQIKIAGTLCAMGKLGFAKPQQT
jgi:hypothetical protein